MPIKETLVYGTKGANGAIRGWDAASVIADGCIKFTEISRLLKALQLTQGQEGSCERYARALLPYQG